MLKQAAFNYAMLVSPILTKKLAKKYFKVFSSTAKYYIPIRRTEITDSISKSNYNARCKLVETAIVEYIAEYCYNKDFDYANYIITNANDYKLIFTNKNLIRRYTERIRFNNNDKLTLNNCVRKYNQF